MTAEWYYPDGTVVPLRQGSSSAPGTITSLRQPTAITLHRGNGALSPTGLYCCGSPTASVDHRLCIHLGELQNIIMYVYHRSGFYDAYIIICMLLLIYHKATIINMGIHVQH